MKNNGFSSTHLGVMAGAMDKAKLPSKKLDAVLNSLINISPNNVYVHICDRIFVYI